MQALRSFLVHQWLDGCAVFDQATGGTHALDLSTFAVFDIAEDGIVDAEKLSVLLKFLHPEKTEEELLQLANGCLNRLLISGLIKRGDN